MKVAMFLLVKLIKINVIHVYVPLLMGLEECVLSWDVGLVNVGIIMEHLIKLIKHVKIRMVDVVHVGIMDNGHVQI